MKPLAVVIAIEYQERKNVSWDNGSRVENNSNTSTITSKLIQNIQLK